jgi:hypothetical protein
MCQKNSVKSVYTSLTRCDVGKSCSRVWKARLLEKSNFFMWLVEQKAIVSKENMIKRNWVGVLDAIFVGSLKHVIICCLSALLREWFGE